MGQKKTRRKGVWEGRSKVHGKEAAQTAGRALESRYPRSSMTTVPGQKMTLTSRASLGKERGCGICACHTLNSTSGPLFSLFLPGMLPTLSLLVNPAHS